MSSQKIKKVLFASELKDFLGYKSASRLASFDIVRGLCGIGECKVESIAKDVNKVASFIAQSVIQKYLVQSLCCDKQARLLDSAHGAFALDPVCFYNF